MAKPKGLPKSGGREKGTPNKRTELLKEKCLRMGIDPFEALLELSLDEDKQIKLAALKEVCQYLYPKRKTVERMSLEELIEQAEQILETHAEAEPPPNTQAAR